MTNEQLYLSIGIPCFMVLINIVSTNSQLAQIRSDMSQLRSDMHEELITFRDMIHADMISLA